MATHVVIIDKTARRFTFNVSPETNINEIFQKACKKVGADSSLHGLKHGNKTLDLFLSFRSAKLPPGAKLELVQLPKPRSSAPASVTVALQMMDSNNARLTEKFPCTTSIWSILRTFEQKSQSLGVSGINLTEQPIVCTDQSEGSGRLFYAMPVVQILNRELTTLEELQKTLQELGYNGGTALLRLKMKPTQIPLEEALEQISGFAPAVSPLPSTSVNIPPIASPPPPPQGTPAQEAEPSSSGILEQMDIDSTALIDSQPTETSPSANFTPATEAVQSPPPLTETTRSTSSPTPTAPSTGTSQPRAVTVLAPAQGGVPEAAKLQFDESEFDLTIAQARRFQADLATSGRPQRLLSDADLAEKERERIEKREKVAEVEIRVRFPDHMIIQATFKGVDKAQDIYSFVQSTLRYPEEPFYLYISPPVKKISPQGGKLALDLQFTHRTLVNFSWDQGASGKAMTEPALNDGYLAQAQAIKVDRSQLEVAAEEADEVEEEDSKGKKRGGNAGNGAGGSGSGGSGKLPKWLKLGGKK